jgi:hypothetical protein
MLASALAAVILADTVSAADAEEEQAEPAAAAVKASVSSVVKQVPLPLAPPLAV